MLVEASIVIAVIVLLGWLVLYMRAQKPVTSAQQLIQQHRYAEAVADAAADSAGFFIAAKPSSSSAASTRPSRHTGNPTIPPRAKASRWRSHISAAISTNAKQMMEETIALYPQIQEFQALGLAYIILRRGDRDDALRIYRDNIELLETRFRDDYTDPDPLLAETLVMFAALAEANGDAARAELLRGRAAAWAPGSVWAR